MTATPQHIACPPADLRRTMGHLPTGVALLTSGDLERGHGMTVNSITSVSLSPPMVLVCVLSSSRITPCITASGCFGISVLAASQCAEARYFADRHRLPGLPSTPGAHFRAGPTLGVPLLEEALGQLECAVVSAIEAGDHVIYLAHVVAASRTGTRDPLVFFNGCFTSVDVSQPSTPRVPTTPAVPAGEPRG
jgi:flavin reductase